MLRALTRYLETPGPAIGFSALAHYQHSVAMGPGLLTLLVDEWIQENSPNGGGLKAMASVLGFSAASISSDAVVLNIHGFGCGQPHSGSRPCNESENALVQHLFMGAWKPAEGAWALDEDESRRRRRRFDGPTEFIDWRGPALSLLHRLERLGYQLPWEATPLLFSRMVPVEPPLLPLPGPFYTA